MPDAERPCQFYLLRYVPNIVRGEFVNLGVLLYDPADKRLLPPRLLENFARVRRLHPWAGLDVLAALEKQIEAEAAGQAANLAGTLDRLQQFSNALQFAHPKPLLTPPARLQHFSNALEFAEPKAVLTTDPEAELERLFETYVVEPKYPTRLAAAVERSRAWIRAQLNAALRRAGLWQRLDRSGAAGPVT